MSAELAFAVLNLLVLPWWAVWLLAPRSGLALRMASHSGIFAGLCGVYAGLIAAALGGGALAGMDYASWKAALSTPFGFLAGWVHYLAFDLFVGAWMLRESKRLGVEVRPYLVFALLLGPIGLGAFLLRRGFLLRHFGELGARDLA